MSAAIEEHTVDVGGMPTRYFAAGAGPPLMLLHGDGDGAFDWSWTLQALARTRRAYAPDLPGSGENAKLAADYSPAFLERFAATFLDVAGATLGALALLRARS